MVKPGSYTFRRHHRQSVRRHRPARQHVDACFRHYVSGIFHQLAPAISGATAGCCLKSSSICGTIFLRHADDGDHKPAPATGYFIGIKEAAAHQAIGGGTRKQQAAP